MFSRQKGLTLVFRNDPLESLKVSSTFDAIPFVRDYLQKEIESQLRTLLMDEVPVIIHKLSQRLWVPEYKEKEDQELVQQLQDPATKEKPVDPLASPPQDPVDVSGNTLDPSQIASLNLDSGSETHALFSQKNLLRLGALTDSHKTLSLFTPGIRDAVFRAWAGPLERGETYGTGGHATPVTPGIRRSHSYTGSISTTYSPADILDARQNLARPGLSSFGSAASGMGSKNSKTNGGRRRKHRVVNLRKKATANGDDLESVSGESSTASGTMSSAPSEFGGRPSTPPANRETDELQTPPRTPEQAQEPKEPGDGTPLRFRNLTPRPPLRDSDVTSRASMYHTTSTDQAPQVERSKEKRPKLRPSRTMQSHELQGEKHSGLSAKSLQPPLTRLSPAPRIESGPSDMMEQPWMTKMAGEIARKIHEQKAADSGFWDREQEEPPPPAYGA